MKNKEIKILLLSLLIVMMGYGIVIPILPFYIESLGGGGRHYGLLISTYGIMQLIFAPLWGSLSDRFGRKPFLLIGLTGLGIAMFFFSIATRLWMLFLGQAISGCFSSATLPSAQSYAADITSKEERAGAMGKIGGAIGLGVVLGPGIGGLIGNVSISIPFLIAAFFCTLTVFIILLVLPESLREEKRCDSVKIDIIKVKELRESLFSPIGFGLAVAFISIFGQTIFSSIFGLYSIDRFKYDTRQVGIILMGMALMYALVQGLLVGPLTKKYGERQIIIYSLLGGSVGFLLILISTSFFTVLLSMSCFILPVALLKPSSIALISKNNKLNTGKGMGIAESYMSMGRIMGPLWAGMVFDLNIYYPFISGSLFFFIMFIIMSRKVKVKGSSKYNFQNYP